MNLPEIVAEMVRKPDAHSLLEWIAYEASTLDDAQAAVASYFATLAGDQR